MRDRKDTRGTKYTYYNGCFLILLLIKSRLGTFPLLTVTGAGEHYEELKATCEKFQRLLCKASVTEEELKLKKTSNEN